MATTFFPTMHLEQRKGGWRGRGQRLKEDGGAVDQQGVFCVSRLHPFLRMLFIIEYSVSSP